MSSLGQPITYAPAIDNEELTESVLKWVWLTWMVFALAMFLPAMRGFMVGSVQTVEGWRIAVTAHAMVYDALVTFSLPPRRMRVLSSEQVLALAIVGTTVNWLVVVGGSAALLAVRKVTSQVIVRRWMRAVFGLSVLATLLAAVSVGVVLYTTPMAALPGVYAWCFAPAILTLGLARRISK